MIGRNCGYACGQPLLICIEISNMFPMLKQKQKKSWPTNPSILSVNLALIHIWYISIVEIIIVMKQPNKYTWMKNWIAKLHVIKI